MRARARRFLAAARHLGCAACAFALPLAGPSALPTSHGSISIAAPHGPLLPGARFPIVTDSGAERTKLVLVGPGRLEGAIYVAPERVAAPATATVVAGTREAAGSLVLHLAAWPATDDLLAVATYDDGLALHRASDGKLLGLMPLEGGVDDVAQAGATLVAPSSSAPTLWTIDLSTGASRRTDGVPTGNEVRASRGDVYVTNRDVDGGGALTRVRAGIPTRIATGDTAEGLAIDAGGVDGYVANVNDATVADVDLAQMRVRRRFRVAERPFSVVLDAPERRIDVVSNVPQTLTRPGGRVEAVDLNSGKVTQRSAHFRFPIGAALDARRGRLFVTDEAAGVVAVLDARTLRPTHSPLRACAVPWRPAVDSVRDRLYVPCARSNAIAAFDLRSLAPLAGSPFRTGGYPLAVTAVRPEAAAVAPASPRRTDPSR